MRPVHSAASLAAGLAMCILAGCGQQDDGVERYPVSGSVTIGGQPVATGQIIFQPDGAAGNSGAPGHAKIVAGKYDTAQDGKGTIGGPHIVRIEGQDVAEDANLQISHEATVDLPKEATTQDFEIPAEAATKVQTGEPPP